MKGVKNNEEDNTLYTKKYQDHISCSFAYKVAFIYDKLSKPGFLYRKKGSQYIYCRNRKRIWLLQKKMLKKHFNKNLVMSAKD